MRIGDQDAVRLARLRATAIAIDEGRAKRAEEDRVKQAGGGSNAGR